MRDVFGFNFSKEESKEAVATEDTKFKGIHISSNGYYGYQLVQSNEKTTEDHFEFMDVQCNGHNDDSDIQFNNFIRPEERLCSEPVAITVMRESVNRKRPLNYDVTVDCKKRREDDTIDNRKNVTNQKAESNHFNPDLLTEDLLQATHGCSIYHWQRGKEDKL